MVVASPQPRKGRSYSSSTAAAPLSLRHGSHSLRLLGDPERQARLRRLADSLVANQHTKHYDQSEIDEALAVMAANQGSRDRAAEITGIPSNTLSSWAYGTHAPKYRELRQKAKTEIAEATLETMLRRAEEAGRDADIVKARMMLPENLSEIPARELSSNYRNLIVGAGIYLTNAAKMIESSHGSAVQINFNMGELVRGLATSGNRFTDAQGKPLTPDEAVAQAQGKAIEGSATERRTPDAAT
jgi:hypothetical protein